LGVQQYRSLQQDWRNVLDLADPAAGQQSHHRAVHRQAQRRPGRTPWRRHGYRIGHRVAHVGRSHAMLGQQGGLKREQTQHVVCRSGHRLDPLTAPSPNGRTDEVHGAHALFAQTALQAEIEVGCIDPDEHVRTLTQYPFTQLSAQVQQAR
jgi:hypothetical protein